MVSGCSLVLIVKCVGRLAPLAVSVVQPGDMSRLRSRVPNVC